MSKRPRLFCFTHAGGNASFFDQIEKDLKGINLIKLEYAGHGERHKEHFYSDFDALADDLFNKIKEQLYDSYALFGYSMGSISLIEVLKRIINSGLLQPSHVFLAAHGPQTKTELIGYTSDETDEWVKKRTIEFGSVPKSLLNNRAFWRTYLPMYRADYSIIYKYKFEEMSLRSVIPATIFFSETDTPLSDIKQWDRFFPCDYYQFSGTHFFILEHYEEMGKIIRMKMGV